jgi:ferritin-like metal-binding protein YciE
MNSRAGTDPDQTPREHAPAAWRWHNVSGGHEPAAPRTTKVRKVTAMGLFSKDIKNMDDLFVHTLRDIYYAEKQIVKSLPEMIDKASNAQLKQGFQTHLRESENHVKRLEQVFDLIGKKAQGVDCPAIDGIIEEAEDVAGEVQNKSVLDAALIAAAQAVEHYEMTRYGTLIAWAKQLGRNDAAILLNQTLDEEKATDKKLTEMAESQINRKAA